MNQQLIFFYLLVAVFYTVATTAYDWEEVYEKGIPPSDFPGLTPGTLKFLAILTTFIYTLVYRSLLWPYHIFKIIRTLLK